MMNLACGSLSARFLSTSLCPSSGCFENLSLGVSINASSIGMNPSLGLLHTPIYLM